MKRIFALALSCVIAVASIGVAAEPARPSKEAGQKPAIPLEVASWEKTKEIIARQKGKIVVLDLWSSWCEPCVKEFPGLVALHKAHPKDVVCISLNCNYIGDGAPDAERAEILAFLVKQQAQFLNLISSDADDVLYKKVGIASVPVVQVYDRSGKLAKQFDNEKEEYGKEGFTYEKDIAPYVRKMTKDK